MHRSGDFQERARTGISAALMVLAGALVSGAVDLLSSKLLNTKTVQNELAGTAVVIALVSVSLGVLFLLARYVEAEGVRRTLVGTHPPWRPNGQGKAYNKESWHFWGVLAHRAMPWFLGLQLLSWTAAVGFYGAVVLRILF